MNGSCVIRSSKTTEVIIERCRDRFQVRQNKFSCFQEALADTTSIEKLENSEEFEPFCCGSRLTPFAIAASGRALNLKRDTCLPVRRLAAGKAGPSDEALTQQRAPVDRYLIVITVEIVVGDAAHSRCEADDTLYHSVTRSFCRLPLFGAVLRSQALDPESSEL